RLGLLSIPIVAERKTFLRREERHEVAHDATRLAANKFRDIRVALLRHQTAARTEGWGRPKERKLPSGPHHYLLAHRGQMDREEGEVEQELDEVVSVSHSVNRVVESTGVSDIMY